MNWIKQLFLRRRAYGELCAEIEEHLAEKVDELVAGGMSREEATFAARREFGNVLLIAERSREVWQWTFLENLFMDVRYALRQLKRNPGFTAVVVITLALGIGANSAVFSVLNGLFLRTLPVPDPERVVAFTNTSFSWPDYVTYRDQAKSFASLSTSYEIPFTANLNSTHPPQHIQGGLVTGNFLNTLRVKPALGRGFLPDEDQLSSPQPVVILSHQLWQNFLGGDPGILGKTIRVNHASYTVVGVMPSDFRTVDFGLAPDLWAPMAMLPQLDVFEETMAHPFTNPDEQGFSIFGRLRPGVSRQEAQAEVNVINDRLRQAAGEKEKRPVALATAGHLPGDLGNMFLGVSAVAMVIAGLVLLIACVNIANLLLARGTSRRREIAIRLAMGAGSGRIVRQVMVGNLILSFLGAGVGLLLAWSITKALASVEIPLPLPLAIDFAPDQRVVLVTAGIAVFAALIFGLAPAGRATRVDMNASLKGGDKTAAGLTTRWARSGLVMVQVAVSVVVLVAATLFLHSLWNGFSINLGFRPENLLVVRVDPSAQGYSNERSALFFQQLEEQVSHVPGVRSASVVAPLPLSIVSSGRDYSVLGTPRNINANVHMVGPAYFETMGIPLIQGRDFRGITAASPRVAVISRAMADQLSPSGNSVGQQLGWHFRKVKKTFEVIGVVGDTKSKTIGEAAAPCLFELAAQNQDDLQGFSAFGGVSLVIKTVGKPKALAAVVQQQVERLDPGLPIFGVETMEEQVGKSLVVARLAAWFLAVFGFLALTLAAVGLYGLMSYTVAARTREVAIRMALGASAERTLSMLTRQGLGVVGTGLVVGLTASLAVGRLLSSLLYGVGRFDAPTFIAVPIVLACVACCAILVPARRATKVDPMVALRYE